MLTVTDLIPEGVLDSRLDASLRRLEIMGIAPVPDTVLVVPVGGGVSRMRKWAPVKDGGGTCHRVRTREE